MMKKQELRHQKQVLENIVHALNGSQLTLSMNSQGQSTFDNVLL